MRRAILSDWTKFCVIYKCSCGEKVGGCGEHNIFHKTIVIPRSCARCFGRWLERRISQAVERGQAVKIATDLAMAA